MKAKLILLAMAVAASTAGFAQQKVIDKAINDPKRLENEAKADVRVIDPLIIHNETAIKQQVPATQIKKKKKKKSCNSKRS
ncbi:MAG: hypothetical protein H0U44_04005 [Flavisolibacter sp.]|jgi:hypothetical protein|nr:hypothetical protein [Flavisolibacter sp.]